MNDVERHALLEPADLIHPQILQLDEEEQHAEQLLREEATRKSVQLPLLALIETLQLSPFEKTSLLICAAPEIDRAYERIIGYVLDDLTRRFPCVDLLCSLAAPDAATQLTLRRELSPQGRLRRTGLLQSFGESQTGLRAQLRLGPNVLEFLTGSSAQGVAMWKDPLQIETSDAVLRPEKTSLGRLQKIGESIASRTINAVGLWGEVGSGLHEAAITIARAAGLSLRHLNSVRMSDAQGDLRGQVTSAVHLAASTNSILFVPVDSLHGMENQTMAAVLEECLAASTVPVVLSGLEPWRPTSLLESRSYVEIEVPSPNQSAREELWATTIPEADGSRLAELASCYRMSREEMRAVARLARSEARLESNGKPVSVDDTLKAACATVARKTRGRFVGDVKPRRTAADLILPPDLHRQVIEIASFTRVLPTVAETWGFGRLASGGSGIKCLFTGDPGTGKTLAAEVVADTLGVPFLKVNIAETVSKWVGETEKNLDAAFREATASNALLFFDEADALFGKRGEVRHGVDRYANLEVSHLLQRLEDHSGLVILASNLKDNIDPAFTRRFHVVLHFPRPQEAERRRLWNIAFPKQAPLDKQVDISSLSRLDITGAAIVGAARTAALLAANEGGTSISMKHIVRGIARQFRREARVLSTNELGPYASLLQEQS